MLSINTRLGEIPKNRYEHLKKLFIETNDFGKSPLARRRRWFNMVREEQKEMTAKEALFLCNELGLTIQQLFDPEHSIKSSIEKLAKGDVKQIANKYNMTA